MDDLSKIFDDARKDEEEGDRGSQSLALRQGRRALIVKRLRPKTWKEDMHDNCGKGKSTWSARVSVYECFGDILHPEPPKEYAQISPSNLVLVTCLAKGCGRDVREEILTRIIALSHADVKKFVAEKKGKEVCDCVEWITKEIQVCKSCGKKRKEKTDGGE